jgi:hypothetical protein
LQEIPGLSEDIMKQKVQQEVLDFIAFPETRNMFESVAVAHEQTFQWTFGECPGQ